MEGNAAVGAPEIRADWDRTELLYESTRTRVVRAAWRDRDETVVVKTPADGAADPEAAERYREEAALTAAAAHPRVVPLLGMAVWRGAPALVFADAGAVDMERWLVTEDPPWAARLAVAVQMAEAVEAVHRAGLIHHDISLANFLVQPAEGHVQLADFGLATRFSREWQAAVAPTLLQGTLPYLAPEQTGRIGRPVDQRADLYSLGVALYRLFAGRWPFEAATPLGWVHQHLTAQPEPLATVCPEAPPALAAIVHRLLEKEPEARYQTARGVRHDLAAVFRAARDGAVWDVGEVGRADRAGLFQLPDRLYGQPKAREAVDRAWASARLGQAELCLVLGSAGGGKSRFLADVRERCGDGGWSASVVCRQDRRAVAYGVWIEALDGVLAQLLELPDADLDRWQARLAAEVAELAPHLAVLPHWPALTGINPPAGAAGAPAAVQTAFVRLVAALATPDQPLLLTVDDLEWADAESVQLLTALLGDATLEGLLVVAAADEEAENLTEARRVWTNLLGYGEVRLEPLDVGEVAQLVADSLSLPAAGAADLAAAVAVPTGGRPAAVRALLAQLVGDGVVHYDEERGRWSWSQGHLRSLLEQRHEDGAEPWAGLDGDVRTVFLALAAADGPVDLDAVAAAAGLPRETVLLSLEALQRADQVRVWRSGGQNSGTPTVPSMRGDRLFQLAQGTWARAADTLPPEARALLHRRLVQAWANADVERVDPYRLARHYALAAPALDTTERVAAARAHLTAAVEAERAADFARAEPLLRQGAALLPPSAWETDPALAWELYQHKLRAEEALNLLDACLATAAVLEQHAQSPEQSLEVVGRMLNVYSVRGQANRVRALSRRALAGVHINLPTRVGPREARAQFRRIRELVGDRTGEQLLGDVPIVDDPVHNNILGVLLQASNAGGSNRWWVAYCLLALLERSLERGWAVSSPVGFFGVLPLLDWGRGEDIALAYEFGWTATQLAYRLQDDRALFNARGIFGISLAHWRHPRRDTLEYFRWYHDQARRLGAPAFAQLQGYAWVTARLLTGATLDDLIRHAEELRKAGREQGTMLAESLLTTILARLRTWRDGSAVEADTERSGPTDKALGADLDVVARYLAALDHLLQEDPAAALSVLAPTRRVVGTEYVDMLLPELRFLEALALAQEEAGRGLDLAGRRRLHALLRALGVWAEGCPANFAGHAALVRACRSAVGRGVAHEDLFQEALSVFQEAGVPMYEALAHQAAAAWLDRRGRREAAAGHRLAAARAYRRWGAHTLQAALETRHPELRHAVLARDGWSDPERASLSTGDVGLDVETVLETASVLSATLKVEELVTRILRLAMENAGADVGALIGLQDGRWRVEAWRDDGGSGASAPPVARAVVQYVLRTRETVVVDDVRANVRFGRDPGLRRRGTRSLLCLPAVHQQRDVAVLYLENRRMAAAFPRDRVALLQVIAGLAAVSLENARLVETLEQRVQARTAELEAALARLQQAQRQMVEAEKMASLGQLTAGVAHEINNPVNFLVSSVPSLRRDVEDLLALVDAYRTGARAESDRLAESVDLPLLIEEMGQLLDGLEEGARRTAEIVRGLRNFSRVDEGDVKPVDVREGLESTLMLLKKQYHPRISIERRYEEVPPVEGFPGQLNQVFMNILANAVQAIPDRGTVTVRVWPDGEGVAIAIADTGPGMPEEVRRRVFEPFFTTKPVGVGTGLGLSISYGIVQRHHGTLTVESAPGHGTTFIVRLPLRQPAD